MNNVNDEDKEKGNETEIRFKEWLDKNKIPYLYLQQDTQHCLLHLKNILAEKDLIF